MSKKVIVTHIFPDLDAIGAAWLLVRFHPDYSQTDFAFVPAGDTYNNQPVDSDPSVIHVDTGMGQFDHHQLSAQTSASQLVFNYLKQANHITLKHQAALERLVKVIVDIDNFADCFWPEASADRYDLTLSEIINNLKISGRLNDKELIYQGMILLDAVLTGLMIKIKVEAEIKSGQEFASPWGKAIAVESKHSLLSKLAQKLGYALVVRKEPKTGFVSIKSQPKPTIDLESIYRQLKTADTKASWFFHQSRHIIVNGSRHSPAVKPTVLSLEEIVAIVNQK
ncbi:hypothetical protein KKH13_03730 [Patescibacteria group bacterium]|nr:hypothetical protein [Patescibacteria group bacterium]